MSGTIEITHNKITSKISNMLDLMKNINILIKKIIQCRPHLKSKVELINPKVKQIQLDLNEFSNHYNLCIIKILNKYYKYEDEYSNTIEYYRTITFENFISIIDEFVKRCDFICKQINSSPELRNICRTEQNKIKNILKTVYSINIITVIKKTKFELCDTCKIKMTVVPQESILKCEECGYIRVLHGTVFNDGQFYQPDGQRAKHSTYNYMRHSKIWLERIQAKENKTFPDKDIEKIEFTIKRDNLSNMEINCRRMREILKETHLTDYNDHAPLLVRKITGKVPPQFSFNENNSITVMFKKIMEIYVKVADTPNRKYYPYFIFKICEYMFKNNPQKLKILNYIHLQGRKTVIENDLLFKKICNISNGLIEYTATDRSKYL